MKCDANLYTLFFSDFFILLLIAYYFTIFLTKFLITLTRYQITFIPDYSDF